MVPSAPSLTHVRVDHEGPIGRLTLDRPERHNSLIPPLLDELETSLAYLETVEGLRCLVLDAAGDSFSTGGDVAAFYDHRDDLQSYARRTVGGLNEVIRSMLDHPLPIVVAADGQVTGGSVGLLAAGDLVYLGSTATITPYYPVVGFSPDGGWTTLVPRLIGHRRTAAVLMTNRSITPQEAVQWGLATAAIQDGSATDQALSVADDIATMEPASVTATKRLLTADRGAIDQQLDAELERFIEVIDTDSAISGMARFLGRD